ncbi:MAG: 1,4-alpha-glucan branching protein GlgB [Nitrospiria bacterium]
MKKKIINPSVVESVSLFTEFDIHLFREGQHFSLYEKLGAHSMSVDGKDGAYFAVWAPNASQVSVVGEFNNWDRSTHPLQSRWDSSGIWEGFFPGIQMGALYKYHLISKSHHFYESDKGDPFAFYSEIPPKTASVFWESAFEWTDLDWMANRSKINSHNAPLSIYEVHAGSWKRIDEGKNRFLTYRELAHDLAVYVKEMGFTHVEFLPLMEHPFYGSWGYQTTGYFASTSRYGNPDDLMYLVNYLHQQGIGVIFDWVPAHFPSDLHGLAYFDGTHLFEHSDPRKGFHPHWKSSIFNYGRNEVRSFLISSALFWLEKYHIDGMRIDGVASMLYLDYGRNNGEWVPNHYGGKENLEAISLLKRLNEEVYRRFPDVQTIAEESTAWPMVSKPTYLGGLGFGMKWNMGWMNDTLSYFSKDPIYRKHHHNELTFSILYAFTENFVLPLSHDEVVHGKRSLLDQMPGTEKEKFSNLRLLFGYMFSHPGKKTLFMGGEWGQWREWHHDESLDWHLLQYAPHQGIQLWVKDLNRIYKSEPSLFELDHQSSGFEWIDFHDWEQSIISFARFGIKPNTMILVICNFTPIPRLNYRVGVPRDGYWREILNSDGAVYGGGNMGNFGGMESSPIALQGREHSISVTLPPLSILYFKNEK